MNEIIDGRGTGKTGQLFLLAKENNAVIVCRDPKETMHNAHRYGITGIDFVSYTDFLNGAMRTMPDRKYYVDELAELVKRCGCGAEMAGYSLSKGELR